MSNELIPSNSANNSAVVNKQAMYSAIMYLPLDKLELGKESSLETILEASRTYVAENPNDKDAEATSSYIERIESMTTPESRNSIMMNNPSWEAGREQSYGKPEGFMGATFTNGDTTTIAYRGTPGGAWSDNGYSVNALAV